MAHAALIQKRTNDDKELSKRRALAGNSMTPASMPLKALTTDTLSTPNKGRHESSRGLYSNIRLRPHGMGEAFEHPGGGKVQGSRRSREEEARAEHGRRFAVASGSESA